MELNEKNRQRQTHAGSSTPLRFAQDDMVSGLGG